MRTCTHTHTHTHIHTHTHSGTNKKNKKMQCLTSINKNLIASNNNRDIFYNLHSLVLLSPTGTLKACCYWKLQGRDDGEREREREEEDEIEGREIEQMDHLYQSFINTHGASCY